PRVSRPGFEDAHDQFRASGRTFLKREVVPHADRWEKDGLVDRSLFLAAGSAGLLGLDAPERYGGGGTRDFRFNAILAEEASRLLVSTAVSGLVLQADVCLPYFLDATDEDQRE